MMEVKTEGTAVFNARPLDLGRLAGFDRVLKLCLAGILVVDTILIFMGALLRYVFDVSLEWSVEVGELMLAALGFLGAATAFARGEHRSVRILLTRFPSVVQGALDAMSLWLVTVASIAIAYGTLRILPDQMRTTMNYIDAPQAIIFLPLIAGTIVLALYALVAMAAMPRRHVLYGLAGCLALGLLIYVLQGFPYFRSLPHAYVVAVSLVLALMIVGLPVAFGFAVASMAFIWLSGSLPIETLGISMTRGTSSFVLTAVPLFIAAGLVMGASDVTAGLIRLAKSLVGHIRGGLGMVTVTTMYFMSGVTGSEGADTAAVGSVVSKPMRQAGYSGAETTAILTASAVMGATVPPSIGLVVLASVTGLSVGALFLSGFLPAIVLAAVLAVMVYVRARQKKIPAEAAMTWGQRLRAFVDALPATLMPVIILGGLVGGAATPTEVSAVAVVYAIAVAMLYYRDVTWRRMLDVFIDTVSLTGMVLFILATASTLAQLGTLAGVPQAISQYLADETGKNVYLFVAITLLALIPIGMLLEGLAALYIAPPLLLPIAVALGMNPLHYAVLIFIAVQIGTFCPPLGVGYYIAAGVTGTGIEEGIPATLAYLGVVVLGLCVLALFPVLTLVVPRLFGLVMS